MYIVENVFLVERVCVQIQKRASPCCVNILFCYAAIQPLKYNSKEVLHYLYLVYHINLKNVAL